MKNLDDYIRSEIKKNQYNRMHGIDPVLTFGSKKIHLSEFDYRLRSATKVADKFIINRILDFFGFSNNELGIEVTKCFTEDLSSLKEANKNLINDDTNTEINKEDN